MFNQAQAQTQAGSSEFKLNDPATNFSQEPSRVQKIQLLVAETLAADDSADSLLQDAQRMKVRYDDLRRKAAINRANLLKLGVVLGTKSMDMDSTFAVEANTPKEIGGAAQNLHK